MPPTITVGDLLRGRVRRKLAAYRAAWRSWELRELRATRLFLGGLR